MIGPLTPFADKIHAQKYRGEGESFDEAMSRVASAMTTTRTESIELREILLSMRFMPAGRIQAAVGASKRVTPYNCYVSGTIEDSFVEGHGSIMQRATEAAATMRMGGGIGYDFSTLRPRGATIKKLGSRSSGPVSFMQIYDAICRCVASSGHRRGAQMGVLRVDHPDILEFVRAKQNSDRLTGFNMSIAITDEFMQAVQEGTEFNLRFQGESYKTVNAQDLWETIMRSTWKWAEPGVLFIDRINTENNLWYCESIVATNPCGEQPLPPFGACLLGSFNLTKYVVRVGDHHSLQSGSVTPTYRFDWDLFKADIPVAVRAMDHVIDIATYPLYEQEKEAQSKRRMGLGVTGLANVGELLAGPYGGDEFLQFEQDVLVALRDEAYKASALLANYRGTFPLYKAKQYMESSFVKDLPVEVRDMIRTYGMRNSHLLSIAPTGTISLCADNVSSGIEPVFSYEVKRTVNLPSGAEEVTLEDYGKRVWGLLGKRSADVTAEEHLRVLSTAYSFVDSAVSKTCNVPSDMPWEDFKALYFRAWKLGCKGCTTFQDGGSRAGILEREDANGSACYTDADTGRRECD